MSIILVHHMWKICDNLQFNSDHVVTTEVTFEGLTQNFKKYIEPFTKTSSDLM